MSVLDLVGSILTELEKVHEKLDKILIMKPMIAVMDAPKKVQGSETKEIFTKEELDMDFKEVTVFNQTEKALLVVKKGYQQWLARQFIKDPLSQGYQDGNMYNIELKEKSDAGKPIGWITKKWEKFEVFKS